MKTVFKDAMALLGRAGYTSIREKIEGELEKFEADTYKIAVTGEFKTGKSTLINKIFLKDDILFTDIMEATAVPTEIVGGEKPILEVCPYAKITLKDASPFEGKSASLELKEGEEAPVVIYDPTPSDVKHSTSAETPEKREELAKSTARVRLTWPAESLSGLSLYDTPGINSLNEAVIATTYEILPEADLALFLTTAKALSDVEMEFLSGRVFSLGITRAMTVITYDPKAGELSTEEQENIKTQIRGQLASIGREYVPVEMVNIRDKADPFPSLSFIERVEEQQVEKSVEEDPESIIKDVLGDLLGETPEKKEPVIKEKEKPRAADMDAFEETLINFIRDNVRPGRLEKAGQVLKTQLQLALFKCSAELSAMDKTEAQRIEILSTVKIREGELRERFNELSLEFKEELSHIREDVIRDIENGLDRIAASYMAGFDACRGLGELQQRLNRAEIILKAEMEEMFFACSQRALEAIKTSITRFGVESQVLLNPWQTEISQKLALDGGLLSRIPPFAILALDVILFVRFGPFGPLADILIRLVADYIPFLNRIMPVAIAGNILKRNIKESLNEQFKIIKNKVPVNVKKNFKEIEQSAILEWKLYAEEQMDTVRSSLEAVSDEPDDARRKLLTDVSKELDTLITTL